MTTPSRPTSRRSGRTGRGRGNQNRAGSKPASATGRANPARADQTSDAYAHDTRGRERPARLTEKLPTTADSRALAVAAVADVLRGHSLSLASAAASALEDRDHALAREIATGTVRHWYSLADTLGNLTDQPFEKLEIIVQAALAAGAYQLRHLRTPDHAAVSSTVNAVQALLPRARGLVNAVLRRFVRDTKSVPADATQGDSTTQLGGAANTAARWDHPDWLIGRLQHDLPEHWQSVLAASLTRAPMAIRVHPSIGRNAYAEALDAAGIATTPGELSPHCLYLDHPVPSAALPDFEAASCTVQDEGAQLAAQWLAPQAGDRILDACAAPGNKTSAILELAARLSITGLDRDADRLADTRQLLARHVPAALLDATDQNASEPSASAAGNGPGPAQFSLQCADATATGSWWDGAEFDRILIDAPCSAIGSLRRNPDIKLLRREHDLIALAGTQARLLAQLWPTLRPGGHLVYCTCSLLTAENDAVVDDFLSTHPDAQLDLPAVNYGLATTVGRLLLPAQDRNDGFYFSRLVKTAG